MPNSPNKPEKKCAYCGGNGPFTKEHIIPNFLYKLHPRHKFGYHKKAGRFLTWEAKIKDVCEECNSKRLSILDAYGAKFYSRNQCGRQFIKRRDIRVTYDYNLLLRWILKITYNSIRSQDGFSELIQNNINFILKGESPLFESKIFLEIVKSHKIQPEERHELPDEFKRNKILPADWFRIGKINTPYEISRFSLGYYFTINAFYLFVFLFSPDCPPSIRDNYIKGFREQVSQAKQLNPNRQHLKIRVSKRTCLDAYRDQAKLLKEPWNDYVSSLS